MVVDWSTIHLSSREKPTGFQYNKPNVFFTLVEAKKWDFIWAIKRLICIKNYITSLHLCNNIVVNNNGPNTEPCVTPLAIDTGVYLRPWVLYILCLFYQTYQTCMKLLFSIISQNKTASFVMLNAICWLRLILKKSVHFDLIDIAVTSFKCTFLNSMLTLSSSLFIMFLNFLRNVAMSLFQFIWFQAYLSIYAISCNLVQSCCSDSSLSSISEYISVENYKL